MENLFLGGQVLIGKPENNLNYSHSSTSVFLVNTLCEKICLKSSK